ncbi:MAG: class I SAM-dependent methyltransferase [Patescibacteria group bacterium]
MIFPTNILLLLIYIFLAIALALLFVLTIESLIKGHDISTGKKAFNALAKTIQKYNPNTKTFYDLGCARGSLSLRLKKKFPHLEVYAIDNSAIRIFFAKLKNVFLRRGINFQKQDIFCTDLRNADFVFTYLWYDIMPILEEKLQKELKKGAVIITNTSHLQSWKLEEKIITCPKPSKTPDFETLFVYIKK